MVAIGNAPASGPAAAAPALPHGFGAIGGGFFLSNGAERAQVIPMATASAPGALGSGAGRGLDAYRAAPVPVIGRAPVAAVAAIATPPQGRRLF
ncbi:MAG TPA: hypothetical protein VIL69_08710, partial [Roseomonas sp.]|jgi:hypothetical protein